jgi:hypothetical protein
MQYTNKIYRVLDDNQNYIKLKANTTYVVWLDVTGYTHINQADDAAAALFMVSQMLTFDDVQSIKYVVDNNVDVTDKILRAAYEDYK